MRVQLVLPVVLISVAALAGCGETCQSTCTHVYDPSECGVTIAGITSDDLISECIKECEVALQTPGDMGNYNPTVNSAASVEVSLETDQQAAAWIDCVWETAPDPGPQATCSKLDPKNGGICAPIPPS